MTTPFPTYLITGASSGIGEHVARRLPGKTVGIARRQCPAVEHSETADFDVMTPDDVCALVMGLAAEHGPFDGIFHAAGHARLTALRLTNNHAWGANMMAASSAMGILRACATANILDEGASVVLMSSVAAHRGTRGMAAYSASKSAIEGLVGSAAVELAPKRIRVNALAAGAFESPMHRQLVMGMVEDTLANYRAAHPLGFGTLEDVGNAAMFLLGPNSRWITGSTMIVDGGYSA